ncbi:hypothetical protein [Streptomyces sp. DH24]|uniref:hypothetical protein n=1 Tax=Streptomyces sp. DH24 TaxID=3040123 RepID=UPI00244310A8|nr:hypothetical protein [Streptomyces sp. DH24]MDG9716925.1 hypothetical protein [Streptomyces sp. DH24]
MRSTAVRRAALAASTAALALLVTACGGGSGDDGKDEGGSSAAPETTAAAKALTAAELEKAALAQADVKSGKVTTKVPAADNIAQDKVTTDDEACAPLAYVQAGTFVGTPAATAKRSWVSEPKKPAEGASVEDSVLAALNIEKVVVTLSSYEDGGAEKAMKDLTTAAEKCAGGFAYTANGTETKVLSVATTGAPKGGDEGLAVTVTIAAEEGVKAPMKVVVVRKGATVAYFPAVNLASAASGKDFAFPAEIVDAQVAKLG